MKNTPNDCAHQRVGLREEQRTEHQRADRPVEQEIIPLDRGADRAGDQGAPQLPAMLVVAHRCRDGPDYGHGVLLDSFFCAAFLCVFLAAEPQFNETGACIKPMAIPLPTRARHARSKKSC
jgi:hypothetical protein